MDTLQCEVRYQSDDTGNTPGRLTGILMTYGERASDRKEMFDMASLRFPANGIVIDEMHNRAAPILRAMPVLDGNVVKIDAPFPDTQRGRDAATNLRDGVLTGLSVEFFAEREEKRNGLRVITRAFVPRAGLVDDPSYAGSRVEVRSKADTDRIILAARLWL